MVRKDLLVTPVNPVRDNMLKERRRWDPTATDDADDSFKVYRENEAKFYLPPFYAVDRFGPPTTNHLLTRGAPIDLLFYGSLRPPQQEVAETTVAHLNTYGGGLLQLRCGFGKTIIALYLFARLKVKTLVLVHKEFLMNQWKERIAQFLPDARVGTLQAKTVDVEDRDIVIGMLQSVSTGKYPKDVYEPFGMCCFDECHHLGAAVFSKSMDIGRTRYMLGLSATPDRKDGLRKVFDWQLGRVICKVEAKVTQRVRVQVVPFVDPAVTRSPCGTTVVTIGARKVVYIEKPALRAKLLGHVVDSPVRTEALMATLRPYTADPSDASSSCPNAGNTWKPSPLFWTPKASPMGSIGVVSNRLHWKRPRNSRWCWERFIWPVKGWTFPPSTRFCWPVRNRMSNSRSGVFCDEVTTRCCRR